MARGKGLFWRVQDEGFLQEILDFKKNNKMEGQDVLRYFFGKEASKLSVSSEQCQHNEEYPQDKKHFYRCHNPMFHEGKGVLKTREYCQKCYEGQLLNTVMQNKAEIQEANKQEIAKLHKIQEQNRQKIVNIEEKTKEKQAELEKITNLADLPEELEGARKENEGLKIEVGRLTNSVREYQKEREQNREHIAALQEKVRMKTKEKIETSKTVPASVSEALMPQKVEANPPLAERITEKITEKFAVQQPLKTPSDLILCPKTRDTVSVDHVCKKCDEVAECPQYGEYMYLKAVKNQ